MDTLRNLYRTGNGPSSSHTLAPSRAASNFLENHKGATSFRVILYGSLAATGMSHGTQDAVSSAFHSRPVEFLLRPHEDLKDRPNGMIFEAYDRKGLLLARKEDHSTGGGALLSDGIKDHWYPFSRMEAVLDHCLEQGISFSEYVFEREGAHFRTYLEEIWDTMQASIHRGLDAEGTLPGGLSIPRKARSLCAAALKKDREFRNVGLLAAYAYAAAEENAAGNVVVTAPTCGACGVLPAVLHHFYTDRRSSREDILNGLATAGLFGNVVKHNGSIAGAVVGCQGEIGTACAMAAASAAQIMGGTLRQIEYAAEMGLEHHFGLTCDPVAGLVQIPCIERNAHAATRALNCCRFALLSDGSHRITFDDAVAVMDETGKALPRLFRETSMAGLAQVYEKRLHRPASPGK